MLTQAQLEIFGNWRDKFKEMTFNDLKTGKSNSLVQNAIKQFLKENLIVKRSVGNVRLYGINFDNELVYKYWEIFNWEKLSKRVKISLQLIKKELDLCEVFYSVVVFGSHVDCENKENSDLDVAVFIKEKNKKTEIFLNSVKNKTPAETDIHTIYKNEFTEMLEANYENLGKQIAKKNLPIFNSSSFFKLILQSKYERTLFKESRK